MAKILFGGGVSGMRGSIAGTVFSVNANGAYTRNRGAVSNRNTQFQQAARASLATVSGLWRSLTVEEQQSWAAAVSGYTYVDSLGITSTLTGFQLFQKLNQSLFNIGAATISVAPAPITLPTLNVGGTEFDISGSTIRTTSVFADSGNGIVPAGCVVLLEMTRPLSAGVTAPKRPDFKTILIQPETDDIGVAALIPRYEELYGAFPTLTATVYARYTVISTVTGQRAAPAFVKIAIVP